MYDFFIIFNRLNRKNDSFAVLYLLLVTLSMHAIEIIRTVSTVLVVKT